MKKKDEWEIPYSEVDLGDPLGQGGYGSVYKSEWRGTQVAVKVLIDGRVTKEMERSFHEEVPYAIQRAPAVLPLSLIQSKYLMCHPSRVTCTGVDHVQSEASQRGALHGSLHEASAPVHYHGVHGPGLAL
jgi:serine/threonine-protein kinase CTR1